MSLRICSGQSTLLKMRPTSTLIMLLTWAHSIRQYIGWPTGCKRGKGQTFLRMWPNARPTRISILDRCELLKQPQRLSMNYYEALLKMCTSLLMSSVSVDSLGMWLWICCCKTLGLEKAISMVGQFLCGDSYRVAPTCASDWFRISSNTPSCLLNQTSGTI